MNSEIVQETLKKALESGLADRIPKPARFALLEESGCTQRQARDLAGYAPTTTPHTIKHTSKYREYKHRIREQRAELSAKRGYSLEDSAAFYKAMSESRDAKQMRDKALAILQAGDENSADRAKILLEQADRLEVSDSAKIRARERLDKLLGFDSPIEIEQDAGNTEQRPVVALIEVLNELRLSPMQARALLNDNPPEAMPAEYTEVEAGGNTDAE